jgi:uncharacterized protein (DUF2235 family)
MKKKIVIFADGTGNAFTTQESNVWRLYQALDQSQPDQIVRYIKGVGTSGSRPIAAIDGATGFGVPSNVRELYRFLCWNWKPGDDIYMFGFSRGAFTIRTLNGLISSEGLVPTEVDGQPVTHAEMQRNAWSAWRHYRRATVPWNKSLPTIWLTRVLRDVSIAAFRWVLRHRSYKQVRPQNRTDIPIKFLGLFDTVEAFGVPFEELRPAIDRAIWPITFRNQVLCGAVERARHALSLDDERRTFHPVRFDQTSETTGRIKEVWFAGVHSDIGGGYPDAGLAYVPLHWMAAEAQAAGLRFCNGTIDEFRGLSSPYGPLHDSRAGLGVIYRYAPRPIENNATTGGPPVIHYSVAEKMVFGSENYAPLTLPSSALVLMPDGTTEQISGFNAARATTAAAPLDAYSEAAVLDAIHSLGVPDANFVELTRDTIWWRRVAYWTLVLAVIGVVSIPASAEWISTTFIAAIAALSQWLGRPLWLEGFLQWTANADEGIGKSLVFASNLVDGYVPYLSPWTNAIVERPFACITVFLIASGLFGWNCFLRDSIADRARQAWFPSDREKAAARARQSTAPRKANVFLQFARKARQSATTARVAYFFSRRAFPGFALAAFFFLLLTVVSRTVVSYESGRGALCRSSKAALTLPEVGRAVTASSPFTANSVCWASGIVLEKGRPYTLWLEEIEPFFDRGTIADIRGFTSTTLYHRAAFWMRHWWSAEWFQPIARIGATGHIEWPLRPMDGTVLRDVGTDAAGKPMPAEVELPATRSMCKPIADDDLPRARQHHRRQHLDRKLVAQFDAPADGELFLYLNDAIAGLPVVGTTDCFYRNNSGSARVTIERRASPSTPPTQR